MMTLRQFQKRPAMIPTRTSWYLADLAEALGKQGLFTRQAPQKLMALREHALVESAVSSNRIEGVEVDRSRIGTVVFGKGLLQDRGEEEVRGYRDALRLIHSEGNTLGISEVEIRRLHKLCRGEIWDAGKYKDKDVDIIQRYADGRSRVRFKTVPAGRTPAAMAEMVDLWNQGMKEKWMHPLALAAALNLDFLCIHPFRDGNGRVSRLLFLLSTYHCGLEAGRYISFEKIIEENKERYYEALEESSAGWHEGKHDPWPALNFLLFILTQACRSFEERLGHVRSARGEKSAAINAAIQKQKSTFRVADLQAECPGVGVDLIRKRLADLRKEQKVKALSVGRSAKWQKLGN